MRKPKLKKNDLVVVVAGYALAVLRRRGALATAGVAASALGVTLLLGF